MLTGTQGGSYSLLVGVEITPAIMEKKAGLPQELKADRAMTPSTAADWVSVPGP